jgi:hypothetical protein
VTPCDPVWVCWLLEECSTSILIRIATCCLLLAGCYLDS